MVQEPPDREALSKEYEQLRPNYKRLEEALKADLKLCLEHADMRVLTVESRVKQFESFWSKVQRERCENPLEEISDICGFRIICYYPSDVEAVCQVIEEELGIIEREDKRDSLGSDKFGYLSLHFIVTPTEDWLSHPSYKGLDGFKAEIQVRTIFQHAWADLSHELAYKNEDHVPRQFRRTLYQLSATLENLDDQFDALHKEKLDYARAVSEEAQESGRFDIDQEVNIDTLQALLDFHFPDRDRSLEWTSELLDEIVMLGIPMRELVEGVERTAQVLPLMEEEALQEQGPHDSRPARLRRWAQVAMLRTVLYLTSDAYLRRYRGFFVPNLSTSLFADIERWRARLSEQNR